MSTSPSLTLTDSAWRIIIIWRGRPTMIVYIAALPMEDEVFNVSYV
jgi:hypothetical protein